MIHDKKCASKSVLTQTELKKKRDIFWTSHLKRFITGGLTFQQNRTAGDFLGQKRFKVKKEGRLYTVEKKEGSPFV